MSLHWIDFKDRYTVVDKSVAMVADVMKEVVSHNISYEKLISDIKVWMSFTSVVLQIRSVSDFTICYHYHLLKDIDCADCYSFLARRLL